MLLFTPFICYSSTICSNTGALDNMVMLRSATIQLNKVLNRSVCSEAVITQDDTVTFDFIANDQIIEYLSSRDFERLIHEILSFHNETTFYIFETSFKIGMQNFINEINKDGPIVNQNTVFRVVYDPVTYKITISVLYRNSNNMLKNEKKNDHASDNRSKNMNDNIIKNYKSSQTTKKSNKQYVKNIKYDKQNKVKYTGPSVTNRLNEMK